MTSATIHKFTDSAASGTKERLARGRLQQATLNLIKYLQKDDNSLTVSDCLDLIREAAALQSTKGYRLNG